MEDKDYFQRLFETLDPKLTFPKDRRAFNTWQVYEPSFLSQVFDSERDRQTYAEAFVFQPAPTLNAPAPISKPSVLSLKTIVLTHLLHEYKGGAFMEQVRFADKQWIGERLNVDMPIQDIVDLDNNFFWKRVVKKTCKNNLFFEECRRDNYFDWKNLGIECKLTEIFENTSRESWDEEKMEAICKAVSPYVFRLDIGQLIAVDSSVLERNSYNPLYKIFNYPPKDCHHGNLGAALAHLENLESLTVQFGIEQLLYEYEPRLFEVSYQDMDNLASGLSRLAHLKKLTIMNSRLDDRKFKILIKGILNCPLEKLNVTSCHLENKSGVVLGYYFVNSSGTLKELELKDNRIRGEGLIAIGFGLQEFKGELEYLGLSGNPLFQEGVVAIGSGICELQQIKRIDFSRCTINGEGMLRIVQMINFHSRLEWLDLSAILFGPELGDQLVISVNAHDNLKHIEVRNCGLTENQVRKLKMIIKRNLFYQANPCMKKDFFTDDDVKEIEEWIVSKKHPLLMRVLVRKDSMETFDQFDFRKTLEIENVPSFIPDNQKEVASTSAVLKTSYIDCFGPDCEIRTFDSLTLSEINFDINERNNLNFDPNLFNANKFIADVVVGKYENLTSKQYFNK